MPKLFDQKDGGGALGLPANLPAPAPTPSPAPAAPPQAAPQATPAPQPTPPGQPAQPAVPGQPAAPVTPGQPAQPSEDPRQAQLLATEKAHREVMAKLKQIAPQVYEQVRRTSPAQPPAPAPQTPQRDQYGRFVQQPAFSPADPFAPPPGYQPPPAPYGYPPAADPYGFPTDAQMTPQVVAQLVQQGVKQALTEYRTAEQQQQAEQAKTQREAAVAREVADRDATWRQYLDSPDLKAPDGTRIITDQMAREAYLAAEPYFFPEDQPGGPTRNLGLLMQQIQLRLAQSGSPAQMAAFVAQAQQNAQQIPTAAQPVPLGGPGQPSETAQALGRYQKVAGHGPGAFLSGKTP